MQKFGEEIAVLKAENIDKNDRLSPLFLMTKPSNKSFIEQCNEIHKHYPEDEELSYLFAKLWTLILARKAFSSILTGLTKAEYLSLIARSNVIVFDKKTPLSFFKNICTEERSRSTNHGLNPISDTQKQRVLEYFSQKNLLTNSEKIEILTQEGYSLYYKLFKQICYIAIALAVYIVSILFSNQCELASIFLLMYHVFFGLSVHVYCPPAFLTTLILCGGHWILLEGISLSIISPFSPSTMTLLSCVSMILPFQLHKEPTYEIIMQTPVTAWLLFKHHCQTSYVYEQSENQPPTSIAATTLH